MSLNATPARVAKLRRSLSEAAEPEPGPVDRARAVPDLTFGAPPQPPAFPSPAPAHPVPAPSPGGLSVVQIAVQEARTLRAAAGEPEHRRRDLLDDLASRLDALVRYLNAGEPADALRALVSVLRDPATSVTERWETALSTLDALAAGTGSDATPDSSAPDRRRSGFWRRGTD